MGLIDFISRANIVAKKLDENERFRAISHLVSKLLDVRLEKMFIFGQKVAIGSLYVKIRMLLWSKLIELGSLQQKPYVYAK